MEMEPFTNSGCPTTAAATALSGLGYSYIPSDFLDIYYRRFPIVVNEKLGEKYTISNYNSNVQKELIIGALQAGYPVVIYANGKSMYTNTQHYLAFIDIDINENETKVYVATGYSLAKEGWYNIDEALKGVEGWYDIH